MRLTSDDIFYLNALNSASGANARDCIVQGKVITYLIKKEELGKAIGKDAKAAKKLGEKLRLRVEFLEYAETPGEFIKKALYNIKVKEASVSSREGKKVASVSLEAGEKRKLLGNMSRVKRIKALAKRNYGIEDIKLH